MAGREGGAVLQNPLTKATSRVRMVATDESVKGQVLQT